jgi:hypothetical protein
MFNPEPAPGTSLEGTKTWLGRFRADLMRLPDWSFVTAVKESGLVASRKLTAGANITIEDEGPGGDIVISSTGGGGGGGAPINASYVTAVTEPALTSSRKLTAGTNITITDGGPLAPITISASGSSSTSPLTTKGDIYGFDTVGDRIPVGPDTYVLVADSTVPLGVRYRTIASGQAYLFGLGTDGSIDFNGTNTFSFATLSAGTTYTLLRNIFGTDISVDAGITIVCKSFGIWANGTLNIDAAGTIQNNGPSAPGTGDHSGGGVGPTPNFFGSQNLTGGIGNIGNGAPGTNAFRGIGAAGGAGGAGNGTTGGVGGTVGGGVITDANGGIETPRSFPWTSMLGLFLQQNIAGSKYDGGGGGGGGGGDGSNKGAGAGAGGGYLGVFAFLCTGTGSLTALGGNGGTPLNINCGGGGGGGGGFIIFITTSAVVSFNISVAGGSGGPALGGTGVNGTGGNAGISQIISLA